MPELRLLLGDQLNADHSWFKTVDDEVTYVLMETRSETDYVRHHIQKVVAFFLAMRHFAEELREQGHRVRYLRLDEEGTRQSIPDNLRRLIEAEGFTSWAYQLPDEYRLDQALRQLADELDLPVTVADTEHFLSERAAVRDLFAGKKTYLMETFYRSMRRRYHIMMEADGETPVSGRWNYDSENRRKLPAKVNVPPHRLFDRDVRDLLAMLEAQEVKTFGRIDARHFMWPVTRAEAWQVLEDFAAHRLHAFGRYQDAMTVRDPFLFHSRLSFALNVKMLHPLEVVNYCVDYWRSHPDEVDLAQIEGFVRQIIGWREFMRGVYWARMPDYAAANFLAHDRPLPGWYWTGKTKMRCLSHAINQSLDHAYAHHIQRLMVTGNFALLLGVDPDEVDAWYLGIYIDAIEWVELTNTRGMSQFADGGLLATKPYVASANYLHKMGDYCSHCHYDHRARTGENACPFNSLYWDFMDRHRDKLANNPRIGMAYRTWDKMEADKKTALLEQAQRVKENVEEL
ncbi:MAG: cryptochrome/photolyase family protein [Lewinella sp.]|nr:cryptochrome/photolyase family protein [Lewinella sp.]